MANFNVENYDRVIPRLGEPFRIVPEKDLLMLLQAAPLVRTEDDPVVDLSEIGGLAERREPPADEVARALAILADPNTKWHRAEDVLPQAIELGVSGLRKKFGLTQGQLASELGISQPAISRIERNPDSASLGTIKRIVRALVAAAGRGEGEGEQGGGDVKAGGGGGERR